MKELKVLLIILLLFVIKPLNAQTDTVSKKVKPSHVIPADTTKKGKYDIDAVIFSNAADSLIFDLKSKRMFIFGSGEIKYKNTDLKSGKITVDFDKNTLHAEGIKKEVDTAGTRIVETPVMIEGSEKYEGVKLSYNYKTQRGFISQAKQEQETAKYKGEAVKKVDKNTYFIKNGIYTTCDAEPPHTYFKAKEMKVIQKDKIIAKWIFMYIGGVPLPVPLPFAVFPNETGRRSGIIIPRYGADPARGQYFRNFGYFFAISDYMDFTLTGDYYLKGGYGLRSRFRYAKRYEFNGNINGGFSKIIVGEEGDPDRKESLDWNISLFHNQTFTPTTRLDVNLQFQSSSYIANNSVSLNDLLRKDIISNATFSKRWDESGNSLTINYSRIQNLESGNITETLPEITFNKILSYPFRENGVQSKDMKWYEYIGYNYTGKFKNIRKKQNGNLEIRGGIQHNFAVSASPKIGYFSISPKFSYQEKWYNKQIEKDAVVIQQNSPGAPPRLYEVNQLTGEDTVIVHDIKKIGIIRTFDFSVGASTKLYGIFQPGMFGVQAFRHTLSPRISYNYRPDFSSGAWGYYKELKRANGSVERYDPYAKEIFGGVNAGERQQISFSIGNIFEIKTTKDPTDTTSQAKKITLLNLDIASGYNFAADSLKLSDLRLSYRTQIGKFLSFNGSSSYTFYDYKNGKKTNTYLANVGKGLFRLTNLSLSVSASISGDKISGEKRTGKKQTPGEFTAFKKSDYISVYDEPEADFSIPWNLSLTYNFNLFKTTPDAARINSNLGVNLGFNLTKNWKFTVSGNYDFQKEEIAAPQVTIYRDLHCWEMNFTWRPLGRYRGYRFEIRMKAPELRDIKVTKTKGLYTGR